MTDSTSRVWENVPSPFCGIASDDLTIRVEGQQLTVLNNGDAVTTAGFQQHVGDASPRLSGNPTDPATAVAAAAQLLKTSHLPVFSGFGTDVNDTRAALALADRCGAVVDQARAEGGLRNLLVLADSGWMACTLAELKNRVDVLVVFGSDIEADFPRFYERFVWNAETLFGQDTSKREIIYIGKAPSGTASTAPDGRRPQILPCADQHLPEVAAALAALTNGASLQAESIGGIAVSDLAAVVERLKAAKYSVVTWAAGHLAFAHAELTVQQLCRWVVAL
ncbi:MAG: formylmethanofuran dehydrogenase subunit B, partial [Methylococcaceae bacterium]|nr:formylmethanofuran dehydrogenase subunit B [Methylococcaceae bacterium]